MKKVLLLSSFILVGSFLSFSQNVGIGIATPSSKLHVKGSANISQLIIDANNTQGNTNPLIKLRNSSGKDLMWIHTDDSTNVFIGQFAGRVNIANPSGGIFNTFLGVGSGYSNNTGYWNTAIGANTLYSNTTGFDNTAQGHTALYSNTTGMHNSAFGSNALYLNTAGIENTAIGVYALGNNTIGRANTATGFYALLSNTTGEYNAASGAAALSYNSTGSYNTANGANALYSNTSGSYNTAVGFEALSQNSSGEGNTACGVQTLIVNTTGYSNSAIGTYALSANTSGFNNTAIGNAALYLNTTGFRNTALGHFALLSNTTGSANTCIGDLSDVSIQTLINATAIGSNAIVNASNKIRLGNAAVTVIEGQVWYSSPSDGRFKENVKDDVEGLNFIMKLQPVSYNFNRLKYAQHVKEHLTPETEQKLVAASQNRTVGFVAQDVEKLIRETGFTSFDAVHAPSNEEDNYSIGYAEFVVPLVKAVQEQQQQLNVLNQQIKSMQSEIDLLKEQNKSLVQLLTNKN